MTWSKEFAGNHDDFQKEFTFTQRGVTTVQQLISDFIAFKEKVLYILYFIVAKSNLLTLSKTEGLKEYRTLIAKHRRAQENSQDFLNQPGCTFVYHEQIQPLMSFMEMEVTVIESWCDFMKTQVLFKADDCVSYVNGTVAYHY